VEQVIIVTGPTKEGDTTNTFSPGWKEKRRARSCERKKRRRGKSDEKLRTLDYHLSKKEPSSDARNIGRKRKSLCAPKTRSKRGKKRGRERYLSGSQIRAKVKRVTSQSNQGKEKKKEELLSPRRRRGKKEKKKISILHLSNREKRY